jgi:hypothetical protein
MPSTVQEHYDWMFGVPVESKVAEQKILLHEILGAATSGMAAELSAAGLSISARGGW